MTCYKYKSFWLKKIRCTKKEAGNETGAVK